MMKTTLILLGFLFITNYSTSQTINIPTKLIVSEGIAVLDDVPRNGFSVALAGEEKDIINAFEEFIEKSNKKYNVKSFFKKISAEDLFVPEFSDKHFNLNAQVRESESKIELWYWVSFGTDIYVNSAAYPEEASKCKDLLKEFAQKYYSDFIEADLAEIDEVREKSIDAIDNTKDEIADLKKDQLKEEKKKEKLESKRVKLDEKLADLNIAIQENIAEVQGKDSEISVIDSKLTKQATVLKELETKLSEQEKTIVDLKSKLTSVKSL